MTNVDGNYLRLCGSHLILMTEEAAQRDYHWCEALQSLRPIIRTEAPWRMVNRYT